MHNKQKGFQVLWVVLVVAVVGCLGFAAWYIYRKGHSNNPAAAFANTSVQTGSGPQYQALGDCSYHGTPLHTVPTTLDDYDQIIPLGNQNVPDHTLPTDHLYFSFKHIGNTIPSPQVVSPGRVVVINIVYSGESVAGANSRPNDYAITFTACKGVTFSFAHVETLAGQLADAVKGDRWDKPCDHRTPAPGEETMYCTKSTDILLQPGEAMGTVGGNAQLGAFDFSAHDVTYTDPGYSNPKWYPSVNAVCALDYFDADAKAQMLALIKRTAEPRCGRIGQDKANTAEGNWFATQDSQQAVSNWATNLALVHNNIDPAIGELAVGGAITSPSIFTFTPQHTGSINREPSEIQSGGVYCFQNEQTFVGNPKPAVGKILVQLASGTMLKVEYQDGTCTAAETLVSPTTYYR